MSYTIYHNPKCSKSRETLGILKEKGVRFNIIKYLKNPPTVEELKSIQSGLGASSPREFIRSKESVYADLILDHASDEELLEAMTENPILIERPIVVHKEKAVIGRPPENVLSLIK